MEKKQKILILNYLFPPLGGGGGIAVYTIARGFVQAGYEVDYVTTWVGGLKTFEIIDGINIHRVKIIGARNSFPATIVSLVLYPVCAFWKGLKLCLNNRYLGIHSHFVLPAGLLGFFLSKLFDINHTIFIHGGDIYDPTQKRSPHQYLIFRVVIRFLLDHADRIIAQSRNTKENCLRYYRTKKEVEVIPLSYEIQPFPLVTKKDLNLDESKKYIIGLGMLVPRKGFDIFIKALARLDDSIEGIIAGDGPELSYLKSLSRDLGVSHRLHFVGHVQGKRKFQYLSSADVFILPSLHEPFGIVLQEAMQIGLPIVSTDNGGQADLIVDGENGFLVPPGNELMIADAIRKIIFSKEIALHMKLKNLETIKKFSPEIIIPKLLYI
jgi:glycosyltransferase involved in cell wall biosynthesis